MSKKVQATAIGIDLGTTYSCVAAWFDQHTRVEILPNEQGNNITPSCVACNEAEQKIKSPGILPTPFLRLMGSRFSDGRLQQDIESWPFKIIEGSADKPIIALEHSIKAQKRNLHRKKYLP
ncbi:hypothetical protein L1987_20587 [Smallanthus sonchifolius]|uniref:Uncharacterized protein n=1 Tax=Smallanthus sonchifolius TaxID=185202 RepID=A0ACB9IRQ5_9ASTR|nr:hypothetical protein L1987_20587 [Smallanthus sonchifolius]